MHPRIAITRKWSDDDVALLVFEVCDSSSLFTSEAYVSLDWGTAAAAGLRTFGRHVHGGLYNLEAGDGGPEYASGAFRARFHYFTPTQLLISTVQQGEFFPFKNGAVATEAKMFLRTEPALLDRFIAALPALNRPSPWEAVLECIPIDAR